MKVALLVVAVTTTPGFAEPQSLRLVPLDRIEQPVVAPGMSVATCRDDDTGPVLVSRHVVGTAAAFALHGCGMDAMSQLVLRTSRGWFLASSVTIAYHAGNMTEFPLRLSLVAERITSGALADGTRAIVQTVETKRREETESRALDVQVCSVDDDAACATVRYACSARGCPARIRLSRGTLIVGAERWQVQR